MVLANSYGGYIAPVLAGEVLPMATPSSQGLRQGRATVEKARALVTFLARNHPHKSPVHKWIQWSYVILDAEDQLFNLDDLKTE